MESNQPASRSARRYLFSRVRSDWEWPSNTPLSVDSKSGAEMDALDAVGWRERCYGSTDSEGEGDESQLPQTPFRKEGKSRDNNPYRFESPDAIGPSLRRRKEERDQRRLRRERDEMGWNEGLAVFVRRRDEWTGVAWGRRKRDRERGSPVEDGAKGSPEQELSSETKGAATTTEPQPGDASSPLALPRPAAEENVEVPKQSSSSSPATPPPQAVGSLGSTPPSSALSTQSTPSIPSSATSPSIVPAIPSPLVPVAAPLLPENPVRLSITERTYPDIYTKVVLSSRTPTVPINLVDMTQALVQGWKNDGEWPPTARSTVLDPLAGRRRPSQTKDSSSKANAKKDEGGTGFLGHHPHVKKGVDSMKRVFRLSGGHHHHGDHQAMHGGA